MITGYNTDVEFDGVVYHVQTEDKGVETPIILSLVYSGGAILASKRSPYDDLVARGFDEDVLAASCSKAAQIDLCAAVHLGRIDELKQLAARDSPVAASGCGRSESHGGYAERRSYWKARRPGRGTRGNPRNEDAGDAGDRFSISDEVSGEGGLTVMLSGRQELRGGRSVTLRLNVMRRGPHGKERVPDANVTVKTLGTNFPPQSTFAISDGRGAVAVLISLPDFKTGRAAILIRAESGGEVAELRKIILPSKG